jgi:hypothetical protein
LKGSDGKLTLHGARERDSFYDGWHGHGTDLMGASEKQVGIPYFSKNFHDTFILPIFSPADDEEAGSQSAKKWL